MKTALERNLTKQDRWKFTFHGLAHPQVRPPIAYTEPGYLQELLLAAFHPCRQASSQLSDAGIHSVPELISILDSQLTGDRSHKPRR